LGAGLCVSDRISRKLVSLLIIHAMGIVLKIDKIAMSIFCHSGLEPESRILFDGVDCRLD
jgi:hypothetical protein